MYEDELIDREIYIEEDILDAFDIEEWIDREVNRSGER